MEMSSMAAIFASPRTEYFGDAPERGASTTGPIGTTVRSAMARMRRSLMLLVAVSAMALMLAGTMTPAEARPWNAGGAYANSLISACFDTGGDPFVLDFSDAYGVGCIYEDVILWDVVDHD